MSATPKDARKLQQAERFRVLTIIREQNAVAEKDRLFGQRGGTPETVEKMRPHSVEVLFSRGVIDHFDEQALSDIADAYALITMDVRVRLASVERVDGSRRQYLTERQLRIIDAYEAWWLQLERERLQRCWGPVIDVAVDGMSFAEIARERGRKPHTISRWFKDGLSAFHTAQKKRGRKK